ncbi:MAG: toxin-antitoxin system YwqK family antitoxin [Crocinitomicaceae bacterium]
MKKLITLLLITLSFQIFATKNFQQQLIDFNYNWRDYVSQIPKANAHQFHSDADYIQTHLEQVIPILKSNPTTFLTHKQRINRIKLIQLLDAYNIEERFPVNNYREDRIPVFIDEYNTHCAVGHLLEKTGYEDLAQHIARTNNYAWVKEIKDTALIDWQKKSGLTVEELKLIQGAYDYYPIYNAHDPNKYEIPQKPEFVTRYFDKNKGDKKAKRKVWCKGEGKNGILHGRWEQNYSEVLPWIVGFFNKGKRTGQWKEYYQGTDKLCRTENWRDNKLNGVRKRFNKAGEIIEEILFKNGAAVTKTNYDLDRALKFIRKPLDSNLVWTDVYTLGGSILASGMERVHNPGNLMWFQNIELTALNTAAITSRELQKTSNHRGRNQTAYMNPESGTGLYNAPPLVEYKKEGDWIYYKDFSAKKTRATRNAFHGMIHQNYPFLETEIHPIFYSLNDQKVAESYDSIKIAYTDNKVIHFEAFAEKDYIHLKFAYQTQLFPLFYDIQNHYSSRGYRRSAPQQVNYQSIIKMVGQYNEKGERTGSWKYYDIQKRLCKTEDYIIPFKEEETEPVVTKNR